MKNIIIEIMLAIIWSLFIILIEGIYLIGLKYYVIKKFRQENIPLEYMKS